jgi:uncharacterized protein (TIRG00374 family)
MPSSDAGNHGGRPTLRYLVRIVVSAGIIAYLFATQISVDQVIAVVRDGVPWLLAIAFALHFVGFTLSAIRWRLLLNAVTRPVGLWLLMRAYLIGMFCNQFLPSTVGGDVYRSLDAAALTGLPRGQSLAIVVVERLIGALALFGYAVVALVLGFGRLVDKPGVVLSMSLLAVAFVGVFVALAPGSRRLLRRLLNVGPLKRLLPGLDQAFGAVKDLGRKKRIVLGAFGISLVFQFNVIVHYILVGWGLRLSLPTEAYFLVVPVVLLVLQLPISLNGIGVREAVFLFFLSHPMWADQAATKAQAVSYSLVVYTMIVVQGLLGGVFFALRRRALGDLDTANPW